MVLSNQTITDIKNASLDIFDDISYLGVSTSDTQDGTQVFSGEVNRFSIDETDKTTPDTYEWETIIGLTEANGNTLTKIGLMETETGDDLQVSEELPQDIEKTETMELNIGYQLTLDVTDNTWDGTA